MKRKIIIPGLFLLALITGGLVLGAWLFLYNSNPTGYVVSSEGTGVVFSDNFTLENIDTTSVGYSKGENITIFNSDDNLSLTASINKTIVDVVDSCDNNGDVDITMWFEGTEIMDGESFNVSIGQHYFKVITDVKKFACPQNISSIVTLFN